MIHIAILHIERQHQERHPRPVRAGASLMIFALWLKKTENIRAVWRSLNKNAYLCIEHQQNHE